MNGTMVYLSSIELSFIWLYITGERFCRIAIKMDITVKKTYSLKKSIMNKLAVKNNAEFLFCFRAREITTVMTPMKKRPH